MPTEKPRFTITMDESLFQKVENFRFEGHYKNQTKAVTALIERGLDALAAEDSEVAKAIKSAPLHSSEAEERLISLHRTLNHEGQEKLLDYADDLVASGKYIKSDKNTLGKEKFA